MEIALQYDGSDPLLYDMEKDRGETKDLSKKHPEVVVRLSKAVVAWHKSMPPDNGPVLASKPRKQKKTSSPSIAHGAIRRSLHEPHGVPRHL